MLTHTWLIESINIKRKAHITAQHNLAHWGVVGELDKMLRSFPQGHLENSVSASVGLCLKNRKSERPKVRQVHQQCPHSI